MTDFFGLPLGSFPELDTMTDALAPLGLAPVSTGKALGGQYALASAHRDRALLQGARVFHSGAWTLLFAGDLAGHETVPMATFVEILESGDHQRFASLNGIWALAALNDQERSIRLVTDRCGQYPLFWNTTGSGLSFSTRLPVFCRLRNAPGFNLEYLYDSLWFQFPIGPTTFLNDTYRVPAASVLRYDVEDDTLSITQYSPDLQAADPLLRGQEALQEGYELFRTVSREYIPQDDEWAIGLTAGWDARTILSFGLDRQPCCYTYGYAGCGDMVRAKAASRALGIPHFDIPFDEDYENGFEKRILETVFISGGMENSSRSSLLYSYPRVTRNGERFPAVLSGIGLDSIFRGHLGPALVSPRLKNIFSGSEDEAAGCDIESMVDDPDAFRHRTEQNIDELRQRFGNLRSGTAHLAYFIYESAPKYFSGEMSIAKQFTTLRIPGLDQRIIQFALSTSLSTNTFSNFLASHKRGDYSEEIFQAYLLSRAPSRQMRRLAVYDVPPYGYQHGRGLYHLLQLLFRMRRRSIKLFHGFRQAPPLQKNLELYQSRARNRINELLYSPSSRLQEHLAIPPFTALATEDNRHLLKTLVTMEIIQRLIDNGWRRFW